MQAPSTHISGGTHSAIEPHLQTLFAASHTSPKRLDLQVMLMVPHPQPPTNTTSSNTRCPTKHVSPGCVHVTPAHGSNIKK